MTDIISSTSSSRSSGAGDAEVLEQLLYQVKKVIVGQDAMLEMVLAGLLARGHVLLEGVPGVAKTLTVETFAKVIGGSFARIQFTPDLVPADIVGTRIYRQSSEVFDVELGPVLANFVLADEINRAPAKVQSALLEVMAEGHVSVGGETFEVPKPFLVLATQNPIENEGVYPLPEAQRDRFVFKLLVDYPSPEEEREIVYRMASTPPTAERLLDTEQLAAIQDRVREVFVHHSLIDYVVRVVDATRSPERFGLADVDRWLSYGASPRATLGAINTSRALALIRGRDYVVPQDVVDVLPAVLRHRLVLTYDALADEVDAEQIIGHVLATVPLPQVSASAAPVNLPPQAAAARQQGAAPQQGIQHGAQAQAPGQYAYPSRAQGQPGGQYQAQAPGQFQAQQLQYPGRHAGQYPQGPQAAGPGGFPQQPPQAQAHTQAQGQEQGHAQAHDAGGRTAQDAQAHQDPHSNRPEQDLQGRQVDEPSGTQDTSGADGSDPRHAQD